ncbi:serine/threonine protein kinase [Dorcoceras hygrometricum]|uniref:Serine/threonine protein kinase n=1 Tax=Dorcoceras hygrometricum TaxID=472368 RepID=A0A2Z7B6G7_9LAMI|nr:serine/threonine protein kinase [Dorcoceras hygrometricum]
MYIVAKYREMLLRKFLEAHRKNFRSGQPTTAVDLQIIDMLSDAHLFALETLQTQMRAHGLKWERECSSILFEGENRDRGAVIARSNTNFRSSCWIRTMILVNGSWIIQEGGDFLKPIPGPVASRQWEIIPQRKYVDTLAPISDFFKIVRKCWADVCIEVVQFYVFGLLQPVGTHNVYRSLVIRDPDSLSTSSSSASTMDFIADIPQLEQSPAVITQISTPTAAVTTPDFTESFAQLRASVNQIQFEQVQTRGDVEKLKDVLLLHITSLERRFTEISDQQDRAYRGMFTNVRQEVQLQKAALSLEILSELNLLHLPFFRHGKDSLEDFDYNDPRCNPLSMTSSRKNS